MQPIYEIARYKAKPGVGANGLREALEALHAFVAARPGCQGIQTFLDEDGVSATDVLAWRNRADADAAMAATEHDASLQALLPLVQPDSFSCSYGTLVLETLPQA